MCVVVTSTGSPVGQIPLHAQRTSSYSILLYQQCTDTECSIYLHSNGCDMAHSVIRNYITHSVCLANTTTGWWSRSGKELCGLWPHAIDTVDSGDWDTRTHSRKRRWRQRPAIGASTSFHHARVKRHLNRQIPWRCNWICVSASRWWIWIVWTTPKNCRVTMHLLCCCRRCTLGTCKNPLWVLVGQSVQPESQGDKFNLLHFDWAYRRYDVRRAYLVFILFSNFGSISTLFAALCRWRHCRLNYARLFLDSALFQCHFVTECQLNSL